MDRSGEGTGACRRCKLWICVHISGYEYVHMYIYIPLGRWMQTGVQLWLHRTRSLERPTICGHMKCQSKSMSVSGEYRACKRVVRAIAHTRRAAAI